ncbi:hypothetical protein FQZ97_1030240 [compost metagenome]
MTDEQLLGNFHVVLAVGQVLQNGQLPVGEERKQARFLAGFLLACRGHRHITGEQAVAGHDGLDSGLDVIEIVLLGYEPIRTGLQAAVGIETGRQRRQHQQFAVTDGVAQAAQDFQAVQLGQGDIQQDQVRLCVSRQAQAAHTRIGRTYYLDSLLLHEHFHGQPRHGLVVNQQCFAHINQLHWGDKGVFGPESSHAGFAFAFGRDILRIAA